MLTVRSISNSGQELCGLVLAGGRSSRMGSDKASLVHGDGRTLALRTYELLGEAGCRWVALSLRADQDLPAGFAGGTVPALIRDPAGASAGPLTGMLAAMRSRPEANWLVVACDLPRLDLATLRALIGSQLPGDVLLAYRSEHDGLPEPLCALYAPAAAELLEEAMAAALRCPRKILIKHQCRLLEPVSPGALDNANTPDEWEASRNP